MVPISEGLIHVPVKGLYASLRRHQLHKWYGQWLLPNIVVTELTDGNAVGTLACRTSRRLSYYSQPTDTERNANTVGARTIQHEPYLRKI